jgi:hypothetical protein
MRRRLPTRERIRSRAAAQPGPTRSCPSSPNRSLDASGWKMKASVRTAAGGRSRLGDCASPRVTPASRGRRLLSAPVVAAERIPASDPLRPAVRAERVARSVGRDSRRGTKGGLRIDHPRQLFWIRPTMEAFADELPSLVCSSLASTMAPELRRSLSREGRRAVRRRNGTT